MLTLLKSDFIFRLFFLIYSVVNKEEQKIGLIEEVMSEKKKMI